MLELNATNYHSTIANQLYWSVSQFKAFSRCEAAGLAEVDGEYQREETTSLLVGSFVDSYFSGDRIRFELEHPEIFKRDGTLKADYKHATDMIRRVERDPTMMQYMEGDKQVIKSADLFGVPWKIKMDVYLPDTRIVDFKTVKDFDDIYDKDYGWRSWIEYWGYDIQGAIYQRVEQIASGRDKPLPFYIAAVTKEKVPDIDVIELPQDVLDTAYKLVEAKIERFDLIKSGDVDPIRCGKCDYCKATKVISGPTIYEIEEAK